MRLVIVSTSLALIAIALVWPQAGAARTGAAPRTVEQAGSGSVVAELSYVKRRRRAGGITFLEYRDFRVKIVRDGQVVYDEPVGKPCRRFCTPTESALTRDAVGFRDLDGGEPEVVVGLFTGGATCCVLVLAYAFEPEDGGYRRSLLDAGAGYVVRDYGGDGLLELVGDDYRFRGAFTCGACGARPIRIWQYANQRLVDSTHAFPDAIRRHSRRMFRLYRRVRREGPADLVKGALTPYVADLCLLDRCQAGFRTVRRAIRRGELDRTERFQVGPFGTAYLRGLKRFLRRTGYV